MEQAREELVQVPENGEKQLKEPREKKRLLEWLLKVPEPPQKVAEPRL